MSVVGQMEQLALWAARRLVKGPLALEVVTVAAVECPFCGAYKRRPRWDPPPSFNVLIMMANIARSRPS